MQDMDRDELMAKARRNLAFCEATRGNSAKANAQRELAAFLDFMHPEMSADEKRALILAAE